MFRVCAPGIQILVVCYMSTQVASTLDVRPAGLVKSGWLAMPIFEFKCMPARPWGGLSTSEIHPKKMKISLCSRIHFKKKTLFKYSNLLI